MGVGSGLTALREDFGKKQGRCTGGAAGRLPGGRRALQLGGAGAGREEGLLAKGLALAQSAKGSAA